jgi:hypothetical protein
LISLFLVFGIHKWKCQTKKPWKCHFIIPSDAVEIFKIAYSYVSYFLSLSDIA